MSAPARRDPPLPARAGTARALTAAAVTLLVVLLPALVAGAGIAAPARPDETARLQAALDLTPNEAMHGGPLYLFYTAALPGSTGGRATPQLLGRARLAAVGGLLGIAGLLYLTLALTRRRVTGVLACLALAAQPAVYAGGATLRAEVPAALFGGLAMLLLVGYPRLVRQRRGSRWLVMLATALVIGFLIGLASACLPRAGVYLLVPGFALLLVFGSLMLGLPAVLRRTGVERFPVRAVPARWGPWLLLTVGNLLGTTLLLGITGDAHLGPPAGGVDLLPGSVVPAALVGALMLAGTVRLLVGAGLRLGRGHRLGPDALLLLYAAAMVVQQVSEGVSDATLAAPAVALLMAEGVMAAGLLVVTAVGVRRRLGTAAS